MTEIKQYAPVIVPTLNRFDHFKRCLESLEKCTGADKTDIYVGLDYPPSEKYVDGWKKIDEYLTEKEKQHSFKNLFVRRRAQNCGVGNQNSNMNLLIREVGFHSDTFISTEDDNEFSPCFLDYINKALLKYWDDNRVAAVCGYSFPVDMSGYKNNVYFYHDQSAWGLARWTHKRSLTSYEYRDEVFHSFRKMFKLYWRDSRLFYYLLYMVSHGLYWGDALNGIYNVINNQYVLYPKVSMCRNHGHDGTGINCGDSVGNDNYSGQEIESRLTFDLDTIEVKDCRERALRNRFKLRLKEKLSYIKQYIKYVISK